MSLECDRLSTVNDLLSLQYRSVMTENSHSGFSTRLPRCDVTSKIYLSFIFHFVALTVVSNLPSMALIDEVPFFLYRYCAAPSPQNLSKEMIVAGFPLLMIVAAYRVTETG